MKLVIVESPAKAKTIEKFLGKGYRVVASYGHIRDLPSSADEIPAEFKKEKWARLAVDVEDGYKPIYVVSSDNRKRISDLKKLVKDAEEIILATDEDREGESISWHLLEILKPSVPVQRIVFHEITQAAIDEAIANPREVDMELVRAQESRRILDRLFGYSLSPVLWKKIRPRLAAGRVQSPAVRLVVEREEERRAFRKAEYWDIDARLAKADNEFTATLVSVSDRRIAS
ncbi:MAG: toprim domain-containing protein, partial [Candidatus Hydrogenedentes bacterium]|nr:toprim domain-containing protein [Candidatus Hydrogenedentota bacterium]